MEIPQPHLAQRAQILRGFAQDIVGPGIHTDLADPGEIVVDITEDMQQIGGGAAEGILSQQKHPVPFHLQFSQNLRRPAHFFQGQKLKMIPCEIAEGAFVPAASQLHFQQDAFFLLQRTIDCTAPVNGGQFFLSSHGISSFYCTDFIIP